MANPSDTLTAPDFLKLLAHDARWSLLAELARGDRRVGELVALTGRAQNLVSYHLGILREGHLVRERRSSADSRDVYYSLNLEWLDGQFRRTGQALHPALACGEVPHETGAVARVLFLCTHNSARSQMAEGLLRHVAGGRVAVASAGSEPSAVHPLAVRVMAERGIDLSEQRSKHLDELAGRSWDVVVTVCDRVREVCPAFPAGTRTAHWSIPDPAGAGGDDDQRLAAFRAAADELERRVGWFNAELGSLQPVPENSRAAGPAAVAATYGAWYE